MPLFVSTKTINVHYPQGCPYCGAPNARSRFSQPFAKMAVGITGEFKSKKWKVLLPACESCAKTFNRLRVSYFFVGFSAICIQLSTLATIVEKDLDRFINPILITALVLASAWAALITARNFKLRNFNVTYASKSEMIFSIINEDYAEKFAYQNGSKTKRKKLLIKLF